MSNINKRLLAVFLLFSLIYISINLFSHIQPAESEASSEKAVEATVFIHGYKGTARSFDTLLERFEEQYDWGKRALVCRVTADGKVLVDQLADLHSRERLLVQVIFENNRASFEDTAYWLSKVLNTLHDQYKIEQANLVGHSMGGIVSVQFLEDYSKKPGYPLINHLIVLGSPFAGVIDKEYLLKNTGEGAADLMPNSDALKRLFRHKASFPSDVKVLAIATTGDSLVSTRSVLLLDRIVPKSQFHGQIIASPAITHVGLHESPEVDRLIGEFLWGEND